MKRYIYIIAILLIMVCFVSSEIWGMPAFARKYKMSCKTCHDPFPRLKEYGKEFAANGFVLKDQESPRNFVETGDEKLSLLRELPIAIRLDGFIVHNNSNSRLSDFAAPYNVKFLSGGALAKNISYYFYFFFSEQGKIVGLEDAFLVFTDLFKTGVSLTVGQFQVSDPLFKRELRLTFEDYHIYKAKPGLSAVDLTYDRGIILNYTIPKGPDIFFEVLNGTGIEEANLFENFDNDKYKNVFGRISQGIGKHLRIGAAGYYGLEGAKGNSNKIRMVGGDATLSFGNVELNVQYVDRRDNNPFFFTLGSLETKIRGGFAELVGNWGKDNRWYGVGIFNWVDSDMDELDYRSGAIHFGYLLRRNIRLITEFDYIFKGPNGKYARGIVGLVAGF
jgi:hypothetical protein